MLRPVSKKDLPILASWFSDPLILSEYDTPTKLDPADIEHAFEKHGYASKELTWLMLCDENSRPAGVVTISVDESARHAEIGYVVAEQNARGKRLVTRALSELLDDMAGKDSIDEVHAVVHPDNIASKTVLKRAGFEQTGIYTAHRFVNGGWVDFEVFSIKLKGTTDGVNAANE